MSRLVRGRRTLGLADQLYRALGSGSANLAQGYSRGTGKVDLKASDPLLQNAPLPDDA